MFSFLRRQFSLEIVGLAGLGVVVVGFAAFVCVSAINYHPVVSAPANIAELPPIPMAPTSSSDNESSSSDEPAPVDLSANRPLVDENPQPQTRVFPSLPTPRILRPAPSFGANAPLPPARPAGIGSLDGVPVPSSRPRDEPAGARPNFSRKGGETFGVPYIPSGRYDQFTAVYDLRAHTVYLPNGLRLEAHSGLGPMLDDPRYVNEKDRGPTPPHLYDLTMREEIFHGVQALRLNPVGEGDLFGRNGLLAHTYMLGPNGDSNGCVSFKDYDTFLAAFKSGQVKRLAVVTALDGSSVFAENVRH